MKYRLKFLLVLFLLFSCFNLTALSDNSNIKSEVNKKKDIADKVLISFINGDYKAVRENLDETLLKLLSEDVLKATWEQTIAAFGAYKGLSDSIDEKIIMNYDVFYRKIYFENTTLNTVLSISKDDKVAGFQMLPIEQNKNVEYVDADYVDKSKFKEVDITFDDKILTGKLTIPVEADKKKTPVVILVHGSGPNDLDESIYYSKPFRDIAYGLSSNVIAVFRYNKRTYADHSINIDSFDINQETVYDAVDAVKLIKKLYPDKFKSFYVLGHSQGGYLMPRIAKLSKDADGFICLAGNARHILELMIEQTKYIADVSDYSEIEKQYSDIVLKQLKEQVDRVLNKEYSASTPADSLPMNINAKYWLSLQDYNPVEEFKNEKRPILFIQGGRDYQVTKTDFDLWKNGLNRPNNKFVFFDDLNHLMQAGNSKSTPKEYETKNFVDKKVIKEIINWINAQSSKR